jgi:hypothetical protein
MLKLPDCVQIENANKVRAVFTLYISTKRAALFVNTGSAAVYVFICAANSQTIVYVILQAHAISYRPVKRQNGRAIVGMFYR